MTELRKKLVSVAGKVAVLMGGSSSERAISLLSGNAVLESLVRSGVDAEAIDCDEEVVQRIREKNFDRAVIMLHGRNGEDGKVQAALELSGIPYTGSGVLASALAMDKYLAKKVWQALELNTPEGVKLDADSNWNEVIESLGECFVKPVNAGSSVGISKAVNAEELNKSYAIASEYDTCVMAERYIKGREFSVSILADKALPVIELKTGNEFYDYDAKYLSQDTVYVCPCDLTREQQHEAQKLSLDAYNSIGCRGWGRVDLMMDDSGKFWLLEVNTVPGMTDHSLVPMAAKQVGIDFDELVLEILASSFDQRIQV